MGNDAVKRAAIEAASQPGASLEDVAAAAAEQIVAAKLGERVPAAVEAAAQPATSIDQRAANIATALVVANNPELAALAPSIAAQIERVLSRAKRRATMGRLRRLWPW